MKCLDFDENIVYQSYSQPIIITTNLHLNEFMFWF